MSQIALLMMGEGEAFYQGKRLPGHVALEKAGIPIPGLQARDGLATINGSNLLTAMSAIHLYDMNNWLKQAEIACAMSLEALLANMKPYDTRLHQLRGFSGAIRSAKAIMKCIEGSDLLTGEIKTKGQDAYSSRSSPQVSGAARDALWRESEPIGDVAAIFQAITRMQLAVTIATNNAMKTVDEYLVKLRGLGVALDPLADRHGRRGNGRHPRVRVSPARIGVRGW